FNFCFLTSGIAHRFLGCESGSQMAAYQSVEPQKTREAFPMVIWGIPARRQLNPGDANQTLNLALFSYTRFRFVSLNRGSFCRLFACSICRSFNRFRLVRNLSSRFGCLFLGRTAAIAALCLGCLFLF